MRAEREKKDARGVFRLAEISEDPRPVSPCDSSVCYFSLFHLALAAYRSLRLEKNEPARTRHVTAVNCNVAESVCPRIC